MKEQPIEFNTAKIAKEKLFNWTTLYYYDSFGDKGSATSMFDAPNWNESEVLISAPSQNILQKWLREQHKISVDIITNCNDKGFVYFISISWIKGKLFDSKFICDVNSKILHTYLIFETHESALEYGLLEGLKLIDI